MKYIVDVAHYIENQGYTYTETMENGSTEKAFTAESWADSIDLQDGLKSTEWCEVEVRFYADDADPAFDDPLHVDTCTVDGE